MLYCTEEDGQLLMSSGFSTSKYYHHYFHLTAVWLIIIIPLGLFLLTARLLYVICLCFFGTRVKLTELLCTFQDKLQHY